MKNKVAIALIIIVLVIGFVGGYFASNLTTPSTGKSSPLSVFSAGSLKYALGNGFNPAFKNSTGINAGITFAGSVSGAREITAGESFDVYITASAGVIPQLLMPNYTSWMVIFASNEMAITWDNAKYNISPNSYWFENLSAPNTIVAVSNASLDPSGFQAIETIKLTGLLYTDWANQYVRDAWNNDSNAFNESNRAWNNWFGPRGTLYLDKYGGGYSNNSSSALYDQLFEYKLKVGDLKLTTVEIGLDSYLTSGAADYAITYKSQAISQNLYYFKSSDGSNGLSSWINLGNLSKAQVSFYKEVNSTGPSIDNIGNLPGGPILYSATILSESKNVEEAQLFIYYLVTSLGSHYLSVSEFDPLPVPYVYGNEPLFLNGITETAPSFILYSLS